jgi:hypothetical protein
MRIKKTPVRTPSSRIRGRRTKPIDPPTLRNEYIRGSPRSVGGFTCTATVLVVPEEGRLRARETADALIASSVEDPFVRLTMLHRCGHGNAWFDADDDALLREVTAGVTAARHGDSIVVFHVRHEDDQTTTDGEAMAFVLASIPTDTPPAAADCWHRFTTSTPPTALLLDNLMDGDICTADART